MYMPFAQKLIEAGHAYPCFCTAPRLEALREADAHAKYDRHCFKLAKAEVEEKIARGEPFVIRQLIPRGQTSFEDAVFGTITVDNNEIEDQVLIKSDGFPTYNFANVIDDHLMEITHVLRGSEYLASTPKYNLLYDAFGFLKPTYIHLPLILNQNGEKLSKRKGDASFEDLIASGFLPEAIVNYIALLGWSPAGAFANQEIFTLGQLIQAFDPRGLSKSPAVFDTAKLTWMNGEYIKNMPEETFYAMAEPILKQAINKTSDLRTVARMVQSRVNFLHEITELVDFIDTLQPYNTDLFVHKKMKTTKVGALETIKQALPVLKNISNWDEQACHDALIALAQAQDVKNGQVFWPIRTALSGKPTSPCGAPMILALLGQDESIKRLESGMALLEEVLG
jgi:glutamyl-tRNA synthetase